MAQEATVNRKVPVTIITGFLGAGKTTLVRHILTAPHGLKIAVIVNEFGEELGIESALLVDAEGNAHPDWYELGNGCMCCTVRDDLVSTIEEILKRGQAFDHILVETTGLADPGPVASSFWVDDELESPVYLDGIITLVDSLLLLRQIEADSNQQNGTNEAKRQIAFADVIVLNKTDLVDSKVLSQNTTAIRAINPHARLLTSTQSDVPLTDILQVQSLRLFTDILEPRITKESTNEEHFHAHDHKDRDSCGECHVSDKRHDPQVHAVSYEYTGAALDRSRFEAWWANLLWERKAEAEIYRAKGVLHLADDPNTRFMLQSVQELYEIRPMGEWSQGLKYTKIVLIGRNVRALDLPTEIPVLAHDS
eukprot:TRINITY_DN4121_c0_g1_i12.p1 TRINITY_DN4121_c0_g1~~TRINITY_DN4121_c0_g1_i12.p1  ORF type:complete len:365 (+),score=83.77 TRINITY_DN4121_c0_g1_i12:28-1122(+)